MTKPSVSYELQVYPELPPRTSTGGGTRSILNEQLDNIKAHGPGAEVNSNGSVGTLNTEPYHPSRNPEGHWHGQPVRIGLYEKGTAATAAKNVLQQRNGRQPAVAGWAFATRRVPRDLNDPDGEYDTGLFATYTPEKIVEGALAAHKVSEAKRIADLKAKAEERAAQTEDDEDPEDDDGEDYEDDDEDEEDQ